MNRNRWLIGVAAASVLALAATVHAGDYGKDDGAKAAGEMPADMMAWVKAGTPGENHKPLDAMVGKWDCTVKMYQPGSPEPIRSPAYCTC